MREKSEHCACSGTVTAVKRYVRRRVKCDMYGSDRRCKGTQVNFANRKGPTAMYKLRSLFAVEWILKKSVENLRI